MSWFRPAVLAIVLSSFAASGAAAPDGTPRLKVEPQGEQVRVVDAKGKVMADQLDDVVPQGDHALMRRGSRWGVLRADGRVVLAPEYRHVEDLPAYQLLEVCREGDDDCGLVDLRGRSVLPLGNERMSGRSSREALWKIARDGHSGVFDPARRRWLLPQRYADIRIGAGFLLARREPKGDWEVFDGQGKALSAVPPAGDWAVWKEGERVVGAQGMYDAQGKAWVPAGRYSRLEPQGDTAVVHGPDGTGLVDAQGRELVPPRYLLIEPLHSAYKGWKLFVEGEGWSSRKAGVMDAQGKILLSARWDAISLDLGDGPQGEDSVPILLVERDNRVGVMAGDGREVFPARFDNANMIGYGSVLYLVSEAGRHGLCDFSTGHCPIPVEFDRLRQIDDSLPGKALFLATRGGRSGLYSSEGQALTPLRFEQIEAPTGSLEQDDMAVTVTQAGKRQSLRLRLQDGQWQVHAVAAGDAPSLRRPYDGHPLASTVEPVVDARYLPRDLIDDDSIRTAFADGTLREAVYPSLQLSGDQAYVWLSQFMHSRLRQQSNTMTRCIEPDGFRLLLSRREGPARCTDADAQSLHFQQQSNGDVTCRECAALNLPARWQRQDPAPRCTLPAWDGQAAQAQYTHWLRTFEAHLQPLLQDASEERWQQYGPGLADSLVLRSRATFTLMGMSTDPAAFADSLEIKGALHRDDLLQRLLRLLGSAEVAGSGGLYPENQSSFTARCAEVWYLRLPALEARHARHQPVPLRGAYGVPAAGQLQRDRYPFVNFVRTDGTLRLAGLSRELMEVLVAMPDTE